MPDNISILIAGEFPADVCELRAVIAANAHFMVVGEVRSATELLARIDELDPQLLILDLDLTSENIIETIAAVKARRVQQAILVLSNRSDDDTVFRVIKAGALGYVLIPESGQLLASAIESVARGESALSPMIARKLIRELHRPASLPVGDEPLTDPEVEVLLLVARGFSNLEIAEQTAISERTVRTHISNILSKLHLANRTQAALWALKEGKLNQLDLSRHFVRVRDICRQLRGTLEGHIDGEPTFFVISKPYAIYADHNRQERPFALFVPVAYGTQAQTINSAPHKFFADSRHAAQGWIGIDLTQVDDEELRYHLHQAWRLVS